MKKARRVDQRGEELLRRRCSAASGIFIPIVGFYCKIWIVQSIKRKHRTIPTKETYGELQTAYDHFNRALFGGTLPACLITLQREKSTCGYYASERFVNAAGEKTDEIAMNPAYFAVVPPMEVMGTLVHEMVHLWQFHFGTPGRRCYHNREWADKMEEIGLMPSDTGAPGGRKVGEKMADYPITGGIFMRSCEKLFTTDFTITWKDRFPVRSQLNQVVAGQVAGIQPEELEAIGIEMVIPETKSNRRKYTCPVCNVSAWGKPALNLTCGDCEEKLLDVGT